MTSICFKWVGSTTKLEMYNQNQELADELAAEMFERWDLDAQVRWVIDTRGLETVTPLKVEDVIFVFPFNGQFPGFWGDS